MNKACVFQQLSSVQSEKQMILTAAGLRMTATQTSGQLTTTISIFVQHPAKINRSQTHEMKQYSHHSNDCILPATHRHAHTTKINIFK